jgi:hypothetical protein
MENIRKFKLVSNRTEMRMHNCLCVMWYVKMAVAVSRSQLSNEVIRKWKEM